VEQPENKTAIKTAKKRIAGILSPLSVAGLIDSIKLRNDRKKSRMIMAIIRFLFTITFYPLLYEFAYSECVTSDKKTSFYYEYHNQIKLFSQLLFPI